MRGIRIYDDSETLEGHERGIAMVEGGLGNLNMVYTYGPPYLKDIVG